MPNIEIHGETQEKAESMRRIILHDIFSDTSYVDEMVVTIFPTTVLDNKGNSQPFLRVVNSCQKHTEEIIRRLKGIGWDIEHLELRAFYPKQEGG